MVGTTGYVRHFSGVRMACVSLGVTQLEYVDLTEDGFYVSEVRHASWDDFTDAHIGEEFLLLTPDGDETIPARGIVDWLAVGSSAGFSQSIKDDNPGVSLALDDIEPRDALMIALARL